MNSFGKYCLNCNKLLICPDCGSVREGDFCTNCGLKFYEYDKKINEKIYFSLLRLTYKSIKAAPYWGVGIILLLTFYLYISMFTKSNTDGSNHTDFDDYKRVFQNAAFQIQCNDLEKGLKILRSIPPNSKYYQDAQAKIDNILIPLAEYRLSEAEKLYQKAKYHAAYVELQTAYGTVSPPLKEALDLLPVYENMADKPDGYKPKINITITTEKKAYPTN